MVLAGKTNKIELEAMSLMQKLSKAILHPGEAIDSLGWKRADSILRHQVIDRARNQSIGEFNKNHYDWLEDADEFLFSLFSIQETNLVNFTKDFTDGKSFNNVVDIGANSDLVLKHIDAKHKIGVNVQDDIIDRLNQQGIEARRSVGKDIPLEDNEVDLTICFETLEHVPDPISFLRELERITCVNGKVLLSIPWVASTNILSRHHGGRFKDREEADNHVFELSPLDFQKILSYTSFKVFKYQKLNNYLYRYDAISNYFLKKHFSHEYFPAIQGYVLEK